MVKDDECDMQTWIGSVRALAYELAAIGSTVNDEDIILVLTQGLPPQYDALVTSLDSTNPALLTVAYVIERLMGAESQIQSRRIPPAAAPAAPQPGVTLQPNSALAVHPRVPIENITCFRCGQKGHYQCNCLHPDPHPTAANVASAPVTSPTPAHARSAFAAEF
ncbi:hypothetical protein AURDEDRAFT_169111 [Auricularia subglabra TFB-10046 SS5]|nr:hypothetical protein AURDEDRAFT_169111 [Auricularia subglabra TFB-10046 SS5]